MALGEVTPVGFEQDPEMPEGTGTFAFSDGTTRYAMEPYLARDLKARLDATAPQKLAGQYVAADWGAPAPAPEGGMSEPEPMMSQAPAAPAPAPAPAPQGRDWASEFTAPPATQQAGLQMLPTGRGQQQPGGGATMGPDGRMLPPLDPYKYVQGRPGAWVATGATTQTERGAPYDPEAAAQRQAFEEDVQAAYLARAQEQSFAAQAQADQARHQAITLRRRAKEAQHAQNVLEQNYKLERAKLQSEINDFDRSAKVDPQRFYKSKGVVGQIGLMVAQALGAYAATLSKGSNFAQEYIDKQQQADIDAQMEEIKQGRISQGNKLAQLRDQFGDLEQARSALKILQDHQTDAEILSYAKAAESRDIMLQAQQWVAQRQQARLGEEQKFYEASLGKSVTTETQKYQPGQAGGRVLKTRKELLSEMRDEADFQEQRNRYNRELAGGGPTREEAALRREEMRDQREARKEDVALGKDLQANRQAQSAAEEYIKAMGGNINWDTGEVQWAEGDVPGAGLLDSRIGLREKDRDVTQKFNRFFTNYRQTKSGAAFSEQETEDYKSEVAGSGSEEAMKRGAQMIVSDLARDKEAIRATYGDDAYQRYLERLRGVRRGDARRSQQQAEPLGEEH